jgi:hypothetical protein
VIVERGTYNEQRQAPAMRVATKLAIALIRPLGMVLVRVVLMGSAGIEAMKFGQTDKSHFLIPPFAFFHFYIVFAAAFVATGTRILEKQNSLQMSQVFISADKSFGVLLFKDSMERDRGTERDGISRSVVNVRAMLLPIRRCYS